MKKLILAALLALMLVASATDYECMRRCLDEGFMYQYCLRVCSY